MKATTEIISGPEGIGYCIKVEIPGAERACIKSVYPERFHSLVDALEMQTLCDRILTEEEYEVQSLISVACIRDNQRRDTAVAKLMEIGKGGWPT